MRDGSHYKKEEKTCRNCGGEGITFIGSCGKCWGTGKEIMFNLNIIVDKDGKETRVGDLGK